MADNEEIKALERLEEKGRDDFENYVMMLAAIIKRS